jgi:hypothetical protein
MKKRADWVRNTKSPSSQNAISLTEDVQIVLRFNGNVEQIHKTFDFVHATNYFTFEAGLVSKRSCTGKHTSTKLRYQDPYILLPCNTHEEIHVVGL